MARKFHYGEINRRSADSSKEGEERIRTFKVWATDNVKGWVVDSTADEVLDFLETKGIAHGVAYTNKFAARDATKELVCSRVTPQEEENRMWFIDAAYKIPDANEQADDFDDFMDQSNGPGADDPENPQGPDYSGGITVIDEYEVEDLDGNRFALPTGQSFQNVPAIPKTIQIERVSLNERDRPSLGRAGMADGRYLLAGISFEMRSHYSRSTGKRTKYYRNSYERWYHPDRPWSKIYIPCFGFMAFATRKGKKVLENCIDDIGDFVSEPVALNSAGYRMAQGKPPYLKPFRVRREGRLEIPFLG